VKCAADAILRSLIEHYTPKGTTASGVSYCNLLINYVRPVIRSKGHGLLSTGVSILHDNARPHTARVTVEKTRDIRFKCLPHPPYSPHLAACDYRIFGPLKEALGGKTFRSDEEGQESLRMQPKDVSSR
jgi:histone-lysine N-methyltransferase SETMAR